MSKRVIEELMDDESAEACRKWSGTCEKMWVTEVEGVSEWVVS